MKDVVTFETAKALKEAGFPQPEPENGQFWYDAEQDLGVLGNCISATFDFTWCSVGDNYDGHDDHYENTDSILKEYVFSPTATDILRELPEDTYIGFESGHFVIREFRWFGDAGYEFPDVVSPCDNPAEGLAERWLKINEE